MNDTTKYINTNMAGPFIKWAGGKKKILEQLDLLLPSDFDSNSTTYVEPFVGGGAMLFHMLKMHSNIKKAIINDVNVDLIACYRIIKENPIELIERLLSLQETYCKFNSLEEKRQFYCDKKDQYNLTPLTDHFERVILLIFLNKTGFNGLYRLNRNGEFNVAFGKGYHPIICNPEIILADHKMLQNVEIECGDFEAMCQDSSEKMFYYFDPPYYSTFTTYTSEGFQKDDQLRLKALLSNIGNAGHKWLLSNSDNTFLKELYAEFNIHQIITSRQINSNGNGRGKIMEIAVTNY